MDSMKIAIVWDWENNTYQTLTWKDGLAAALRELIKRGHDVKVITCGNDMVIDHGYFPIYVTSDVVTMVRDYKPDIILHWGDFTRPHAQPLRELGIPMAICFAGGEAVNYNTPYFDHIFVESEVYKTKLEQAGYENVSIAFGTNTELFKPVEQSKQFDTIFPATFAAWKRHNIYADAVKGLRALACGYMYDDHETECWKDTAKKGVVILPHVSAETLKWLYGATRACVITSSSAGGSQRTVLEAMAMNIPLIVTDSDKYDYITDEVFQVDPTPEAVRNTIDFILENNVTVNTRRYVEEKWSEYAYADELEKGMKSIL